MRTPTNLLLMAISLAAAAGRAGAEMPQQGIYVRLVAFDRAFKSEWSHPEYSAQDILKMIEELKPDVLNRFTTGRPKMDCRIPVAAGAPPMDFVQFLNAAMKAGAPGCILTPKVHLNDIWTDEYRMQAAQELHDLPVTPRLTALDLDCYFTTGSVADHKRMLQQFANMGWTDFGFNPGAVKPVYGYGSYGMPPLSRKTWTVNPEGFEKWRKEGVKTCLLHIDYPRGIQEFAKLPPDRQADIITKNVCPLQHKYGFRFIYPILYAGYDANKVATSPDGPYKGATMFEVIKQMIELDRNNDQQSASPAKR